MQSAQRTLRSNCVSAAHGPARVAVHVQRRIYHCQPGIFSAGLQRQQCSLETQCHRKRRDQDRVVVKSASTNTQYTDKPIPNAFWRVFAAFMYLAPALNNWMGAVWVYKFLPPFLLHHLIVGAGLAAVLLSLSATGAPWWPLYMYQMLVPLILFFLTFLAVVKNKALHHFIRFNAMMSLMIDIVFMLPPIVNSYIPGEIFWSQIGMVYRIGWKLTAFTTIWYCAVCCMAGYYAELPVLSEASYMQVYQVEFMD